MLLDDGSSIQLGESSSSTEINIDFPGPLVGMAYRYGDSTFCCGFQLEALAFIYDTCYCDFTATPDTATVLMGEQTNIAFTTVSKLGDDVFQHTVDTCGKANSVT